MWKDSAGAVMPVIRVFGDPNNGFFQEFEMIDPGTGYVWHYALTNPVSITAVRTSITGWVSADCSGTEYVATPPPPRYAFTLPLRNGFYVIPDNLMTTQTGLLSGKDRTGTCGPGALSTWTVPVASLITITQPSGPPGVPPYHPEMF